MIPHWPRAAGEPVATARLRSCPEDFQVEEQLGFEPGGEGEHVFLFLQKRNLNSMELVQRIARLAGVPQRDIGLGGLKDRNAVTRQWFSVRLAGKPEPDWQELAADAEVQVLRAERHLKKLKRGVHRGNRFTLVLRDLEGDRELLEQRLRLVQREGAPNYFGEQRFGHGGSTLSQARQWRDEGGRRISRNRRSLYLSALRAHLFNTLLAQRVQAGSWNVPRDGDLCLLQGTRSQFRCERVDEALLARAKAGDIHPGLPLWGRGLGASGQWPALAGEEASCEFLERMGLEAGWRAARCLPDDFCWQFCDDGSLQLEFGLGAGSYATALLAEFVRYNEN